MIRVVSLTIISLSLVSCRGFRSTTSGGCCNDISVEKILDQQPIPDELGTGRIDVELRFDAKGVVATLADRNLKTVYYYSEDGGATWRHDGFYQELRAWQSRIMHDGEVLPWNPNLADASVRYRTIHFPERKSYHERSTDGGKTWTRMKGNILGCDAEMDKGGTYFYHPRDPLTLYQNSFVLGWEYGFLGMLVSVDGGDTFRFMYESARPPALVISRSNPEVMYGAAPTSLLRSTDGGQSWDLVGQNDLIRKTWVRGSDAGTEVSGKPFAEPTYIDDIAIDPVDANRVYVVASKGLLRTENGGETWCVLNTGITKVLAIHSIAIAPARPDVLFVGTYKGLMRSVDRGCHWEWIDVLSRARK